MRLRHSERKMTELFANSGDPDQTPQNAASDLGLALFASYPFEVWSFSRLQLVRDFTVDPFSEGVGVKKNKQEVTKFVVKWRKINQVSIPLNCCLPCNDGFSLIWNTGAHWDCKQLTKRLVSLLLELTDWVEDSLYVDAFRVIVVVVIRRWRFGAPGETV